jgi:hypothetical protein
LALESRGPLLQKCFHAFIVILTFVTSHACMFRVWISINGHLEHKYEYHGLIVGAPPSLYKYRWNNISIYNTTKGRLDLCSLDSQWCQRSYRFGNPLDKSIQFCFRDNFVHESNSFGFRCVNHLTCILCVGVRCVCGGGGLTKNVRESSWPTPENHVFDP